MRDFGRPTRDFGLPSPVYCLMECCLFINCTYKLSAGKLYCWDHYKDYKNEKTGNTPSILTVYARSIA